MLAASGRALLRTCGQHCNRHKMRLMFCGNFRSERSAEPVGDRYPAALIAADRPIINLVLNQLSVHEKVAVVQRQRWLHVHQLETVKKMQLPRGPYTRVAHREYQFMNVSGTLCSRAETWPPEGDQLRGFVCNCGCLTSGCTVAGTPRPVQR